MFDRQLQSARSEAAASTLALIRSDRENAPRKVKPLLAYVEEHLFDAGGLKVKTVLRECGVQDHMVRTLFHSAVSQTPRSYIEDGRLVVVSNLLRDTDIHLLTIAHLTGYRDEEALERAFRRWCGMDLGDFRRQAKATLARVGKPSFELHPIELRRKAFSGKLDPDDAAALRQHLRAIYEPHLSSQEDDSVPSGATMAPEVSSEADSHETTPQSVRFNRETASESLVEMFWESIRDEPEAERRAMVRVCPLPSLFHLLLQKSREQLHDDGKAEHEDRRRGVRLAELAIDSLEGCELTIGEKVHDLRALGWAWVARARRLAADLSGAAEALDRAEVEWNVPRQNPNPAVEAQIQELGAVTGCAEGEEDEDRGSPRSSDR